MRKHDTPSPYTGQYPVIDGRIDIAGLEAVIGDPRGKPETKEGPAPLDC